MTYHDEDEVRAAFWEQHPGLETLALQRGTRHLPQNYQPTDIRVVFVDFVDGLQRSGDITDELAQDVTL